MLNWPTLKQLASMIFADLEDARKAIAALSPDDPDRMLFLFSTNELCG